MQKRVCPFKHNVMITNSSYSNSNSSESNVQTPNVNKNINSQSERDYEKEKEQDLECNRVKEFSSRSIVSSAEERYENGKALYCKKICSEKYNIHVHEKDDVTTYKGVQM